MRRKAISMIAWCLAGSTLAFAQGEQAPRATETTTPDIPGVVAGGTKVQIVYTWEQGLGGEGPVGLPDGSIVFTQQSKRRIVKISPDGTASTHLDTQPNQILALAYDLNGRLLGTQRGEASGVAVLGPTPTMLAEKFEGRKFARPNDLVVDTKGGVYFTDNTGLREGEPPPPADAAGQGIYYITPSGEVLLAHKGYERPNGVQLSPDGKVLYIGTGAAHAITAFDVQPDGRLTNQREFAPITPPGKPSGADGMAMDADGRLYVAANPGVMVFSPQGMLLGTIPISIKPTSLAFGGHARDMLYVIVGRGVAFKIAMLSKGVNGRAK